MISKQNQVVFFITTFFLGASVYADDRACPEKQSLRLGGFDQITTIQNTAYVASEIQLKKSGVGALRIENSVVTIHDLQRMIPRYSTFLSIWLVDSTLVIDKASQPLDHLRIDLENSKIICSNVVAKKVCITVSDEENHFDYRAKSSVTLVNNTEEAVTLSLSRLPANAQLDLQGSGSFTVVGGRTGGLLHGLVQAAQQTTIRLSPELWQFGLRVIRRIRA